MSGKIITIIILSLLFSKIYSQRPYINEFMSIGGGARAMAMSNSVIAGVNDVSSGYYNPAGLVSIQNKYSIGLMHASYFAGIANFDYAAGSFKIDDNRSVGISMLRFGVDDIQNTNELFDNENNFLGYDRIKKFSVADYGLLLSYGQKSKIENLQYGVNVKIIHRITGEFASAWGFGFDAGVQYKKNNWMFGGMLRDATSTFNAWSFNNDKLEITVLDSTFNTIAETAIEVTLPKMLLGVGRSFKINNDISLLAEGDIDLSFDGEKHSVISNKVISIDPHLGLEADYKKIIFFRAGVGNIQDVKGFDGSYWSFEPNIGIGISVRNFVIDYSLTDIGDQSVSEFSNIFSLKFLWK